jgi:transglutaminase-like putative cysteine protease
MRILCASFMSILLIGDCVQASNEPPDWVKEAAHQAVPEYSERVTSVVLLQEESVIVDEGGRHVMRERGAIKILHLGETDIAAARTYNSKSGKIRDFQGWLIDPSGKTTAYGKDRIIDLAVTQGLYEELRTKYLKCGNASPGSVFAWEITEEEKTLFTQYQYDFQQRKPVLISRFSLEVPAGWEFKATSINRETIDAEKIGTGTKWELRNLPWIEEEEQSPPLSTLTPRILVSYFPPPENSAGLRGLKDWAAVSSWLTGLVDPPAAVTETVRSKALQLTSNASGEPEKIRAIAAFVQQLKYVAVTLNLTRGGGYTPRQSEETLARAYGDCKDKATLMRALLKALGIESYLVTISADDRTYVRPEWASPTQFNHAIVAIRVSPAVAGSMVLETKALGRLLVFDPTDSITPVGDLPLDEQGSFGLILAGNEGQLVKMPMEPAADNRIESKIEAVLDSVGRVEARITRSYYGQSSVSLYSTERQGAAELRRRFEESYAHRLPTASLSSISTESHPEESLLKLSLNLAADRFGQVMQGRLFVAHPGYLISSGSYSFPSKKRSTPIQLEADQRRNNITIKLPDGFKIDEIPKSATIETPYGKIETNWTTKDGAIVMEETLEIREMMVPASEYTKAREFFDLVNGAHNAAVILTKAGS